MTVKNTLAYYDGGIFKLESFPFHFLRLVRSIGFHLVQSLLVEKHLVDRNLANIHLGSIFWADRHLADKHVADRHLVSIYWADRHLADRHLSDRNLAGRQQTFG
jgi:hypothetical protein